VSDIELLTYEEAARYLGIGLTSLKKHVRNGVIPVYSLGPGGRIRRFKRSDLDRFLKGLKREY